jgi:hypothetical protein
MLTQCSHISLKRGSVYYYRRRLPRPHQTDIALSLSTTNFRKAEYLARVLDQVFDSFFREEVKVVDIHAILRDQLKAALNEDRQQHLSTPPRRPVYVLSVAPHEDPVEADIEAIQLFIHDSREALALRDINRVRGELGLGLIQVEIEMLEQALENLKGGLVGRVGEVADQE